MSAAGHAARRCRVLACAVLCTTAAITASAQFMTVPAPDGVCAAPMASTQQVDAGYRVDAARHVYACYPKLVFKGQLPPLVYSAMVVETELDATGQVVNVSIVRKPAVDEVAPWVVALIRRAAPYPAPARLPGRTARFMESWFIDRSGRFQTHSLTEGQR